MAKLDLEYKKIPTDADVPYKPFTIDAETITTITDMTNASGNEGIAAGAAALDSALGTAAQLATFSGDLTATEKALATFTGDVTLVSDSSTVTVTITSKAGRADENKTPNGTDETLGELFPEADYDVSHPSVVATAVQIDLVAADVVQAVTISSKESRVNETVAANGTDSLGEIFDSANYTVSHASFIPEPGNIVLTATNAAGDGDGVILNHLRRRNLGYI
jgi:hypothetical protein